MYVKYNGEAFEGDDINQEPFLHWRRLLNLKGGGGDL